MRQHLSTIIIAALLLVVVVALCWRHEDETPLATSSGQKIKTQSTAGAPPDVDTRSGVRVETPEVTNLDCWTLELSWLDDGSPVPSASIYHSRDAVSPLTTDVMGRCAIAHLGFGYLQMRITAKGAADVELSIPEPSPGSTQSLALRRSVRAEIQVRDAATGEAIEGAQLFVEPIRAVLRTSRRKLMVKTVPGLSQARADARTDTTGCATLRRTHAGIYSLFTLASSYIAKDVSPFELPLISSPYVIELAKGHTFQVKVADKSGKPKRGWTVSFTSDGYSSHVETNDLGLATSPGYAEGTRVTAHILRKDLSAIASLWEGLQDPVKEEVTLPHERLVELVAPVERRHEIIALWSPVKGDDRLCIDLFMMLDGRGFAKSDTVRAQRTEGRASIGAPGHGTYQLIAVGEQSGIWRSTTFVVRDRGVTEVRLQEQESRSGRISGNLSSQSGERLSGARIVLRALPTDLGLLDPAVEGARTRGETIATATSALDGTFELAALLPGRYTIEALHPRGFAHVQTVVIEPSSAEIQLDLMIPSGARILGRVLEHDVGRRMFVRANQREHMFERTALVDARGEFELQFLPGGTYDLQLHELPSMQDPAHVVLNRLSRRAEPDASVRVEAGAEATCEILGAGRTRDIHVHSSYREGDSTLEVVLEKLHPYDKTGASLWSLARPLNRAGETTFRRIDTRSSYGVSIRIRSTGRVIDWGIVRPGRGRVKLELATGSWGKVTVITSTDPAKVALVPVSGEGTPLRDTILRPRSTSAGKAIFEGVRFGAYRAVRALERGFLGRSFGSKVFVVQGEHTQIQL